MKSSVKKALSFALVFAIVLSMFVLPAAVAIDTTNDYGIKIEGTKDLAGFDPDAFSGTKALGDNEFLLKFYVKSQSQVSGVSVILKMNSSILTLADPVKKSTVLDWTSTAKQNKVILNGQSYYDTTTAIADLSTGSVQVFAADGETNYKILKVDLAADPAVTTDGNYHMYACARVTVDGGIAALDENSIQLATKKEDIRETGTDVTASVVKSSENEYVYNFVGLTDSTNIEDKTDYKGLLSGVDIAYPHSGSLSLMTGESYDVEERTVAETTSLWVKKAPEKGKVYGDGTNTDGKLAQLVFDGLLTGETITNVAVTGTTAANDYAVTTVSGDPNTYFLTNTTGISGEESKTVTVTATVTGSGYTTTSVFVLNLEEVVLPPAVPASTTGQFVLGDGEPATLSEALDGKLPSGWRVMTAEDADKVTGFTALTTAQLDAEVSVQSYTVPMFYPKDENYADTGANFTLSVVAGPSQTTITNLTKPANVTKTTTSIKFTDATNANWEYQLSATKHTEVNPSAALESWEDGATGGVEFTGLTPGTNYYLNVRVKDNTSVVSYAENPIATDYDLGVAAYLKTDAGKTTNLVLGGTVTVKTTGPITTTDDAATYKQDIILTNLNENSLYRVTATITDDNDNAFGTPDLNGYTGEAIVKNGTLTITITPAAGISLGEHTATLHIEAWDAATEGTKVISDDIPLSLTVYGHRANNSDSNARYLRPHGTTADDTAAHPEANQNAKIELNATWNDVAASSYVYTGSVGTVAKDTNDNKWYLTLADNVTTLGELIEIKAVFDAIDSSYYVAEEENFKIYVKGTLADAIAANERTQKVTIPATGAEAWTKDLTFGITGASVAETAAGPTGVTLDVGTGVVTIANADTTTAGGHGVYTVTIPTETTEYTADTTGVVIDVYALKSMENKTLTALNQVVGDTIELTVDSITVDATAYTPNAWTLDGNTVTPDGNGKITVPSAAGNAGKHTMVATVPEDTTTNYTASFTITQDVYVRAAAVWTNDDDITIDYDVAGERTGTIPAAAGGAALTYTVTEGRSIVSVDSAGAYTASGNAFGVATVKITSAQTDSQLAGETTVAITVKTVADNGGEQTVVGGAILGNVNGTETGFTTKIGDVAQNNAWEAPYATYVKFTGLTQGVTYEYRVWFSTEDYWHATDTNPDGWTEKTAEGDIITTADFTLTPIVRAEIRYADDGTIGDTVVDETPVKFTIHHLIQGVSYEYRVLNEDDSVDVDWTAVPAYDAAQAGNEAGKIFINEGGDPALYSYKFAYDGTGTEVETRYANSPVITKDGDDYVISGLIPSTNYDLQSLSLTGFVEDNPETTETNECNYLTRKASATGTITISYVASGADNYATSEYAVLEIATNNGVRIRQSATDSTKPGDPKPIVAGVKVKGSVTSTRLDVDIVIKLIQNDEVKYSFTIEGDAAKKGAGSATQTFTIEGVVKGDYKLTIEKIYNLTFTKRTLSVGDDDDVDLDKVLGHAVQLIAGDLTKDGQINISDLTMLLDTSNYGNPNPANPGADLTGDGLRNISDLTKLLDTSVYGQTNAKQTVD